MNNKPTEKQIEAEIKALEACKKYIPARTIFGDYNFAKLDLQIDFLRGEIDTTAEEFLDFSDDEQSAILEAENWENGDSNESPSSGWDTFKPKVKVKKKKSKIRY